MKQPIEVLADLYAGLMVGERAPVLGAHAREVREALAQAFLAGAEWHQMQARAAPAAPAAGDARGERGRSTNHEE